MNDTAAPKWMLRPPANCESGALPVLPVLCRAEIIRAIRIRKLLEQADAEDGPTAEAYRERALTMAAAYPRGKAITYNGKPLLDCP